MTKPYVVQVWIRPIAEDGTQPWCDEGHALRGTPNAAWEVRFYQNTNQMEAWMEEGIALEEIIERAWEETCQEQAEALVCHRIRWMCETHVSQLVEYHGIDRALHQGIFTSVRHAVCSFAVVADRDDATTFLVSGLPWRAGDLNLSALLDERTTDILWNTGEEQYARD